MVPFGVGPASYGAADQIAIPPPPPPMRLQANFADMSATVYVGHICNRVDEDSIKELLDLCGQVTKWSRQPDPMTGKWAHFGFCDFKRLEGAWRAVELLDGRQLGSRKLVVKADAKVQERIKEFPMTQRINAENEQRVMSTVNALLTAINAKWRQVAMATDAERQDVTTEKSKRAEPSIAVESDPLPRWYRESRVESERLRRIERRRRDRQQDFEKALRDWERHEVPKMLRELEKDAEDPNSVMQKKRKLIEQDGGTERVVSNFSLAERRKEAEADDRDRLQEQSEIAAKREKDESEYRDLAERMKALSSKLLGVEKLHPARQIVSNHETVPEELQVQVKQIPTKAEELNKIALDWSRLLNEQTLLKLRSWLRRKLARFGATEDEAILLSGFVVKSIELERPGFDAIVAKLSMYPRLTAEISMEVASKCVQLLFFEQLVLSHSSTG